MISCCNGRVGNQFLDIYGRGYLSVSSSKLELKSSEPLMTLPRLLIADSESYEASVYHPVVQFEQ
jgi:hypothetical protein